MKIANIISKFEQYIDPKRFRTKNTIRENGIAINGLIDNQSEYALLYLSLIIVFML